MNCAAEHSHQGLARTLATVGDKWTVALIHHLVQGKNRFGLLHRAMPGINPKMLSLRLRKLEASGVITKTIYPGLPLHVEYGLTEKGQHLQKVLQTMDEWGESIDDQAGSTAW